MAEESAPTRHSTPVANVSRRIVQLHKEFYGKGPTKAKTYYHGDLVVVLMRGGFTRVEETLLHEGRGGAVIDQRREFQQVMEGRFSEVIEDEIGRKVVAFMSGSHQDPDLIAEIFVLDPTDMTADEKQEPGAAHGTPEDPPASITLSAADLAEDV